MPNLPRPIHLVAEAPVLDAERFGAAVRLAQIAPRAAGWAVDVFDEVARMIEPARTKIDRQHHLCACGLAPVSELVHADLVGLGRVPREVESGRPLLARANPVFPIVGRDEIAARIPNDRNFQFANEVDDVLAHPVGVGAFVIGLVDPGIDRSPQMLEEGAVQAIVDCRDLVVPIGDNRGAHRSSHSISRKFDILDLLPAAASSCESIRTKAVFASVKLEETSADVMPFRPGFEIVPWAPYQIC